MFPVREKPQAAGVVEISDNQVRHPVDTQAAVSAVGKNYITKTVHGKMALSAVLRRVFAVRATAIHATPTKKNGTTLLLSPR